METMKRNWRWEKQFSHGFSRKYVFNGDVEEIFNINMCMHKKNDNVFFFFEFFFEIRPLDTLIVGHTKWSLEICLQ